MRDTETKMVGGESAAALKAEVARLRKRCEDLRVHGERLVDDLEGATARIERITHERDALAAEVARMRAEHEAPGLRWYAYDAECGYDTYPTAAQAKAAAEASIEHGRDHDGWPEEIDQVEWGRLIPYERAAQTDYVAAEDDETGRCAREGLSHLCNYELRSVRP